MRARAAVIGRAVAPRAVVPATKAAGWLDFLAADDVPALRAKLVVQGDAHGPGPTTSDVSTLAQQAFDAGRLTSCRVFAETLVEER